MNNISVLLRQFNWRALLVRFVVNAITLLVVVVITPRVYFVNGSVASLLFLALALGILNGLIKPIIHFFTLPFIFATYGLIVILVNSTILWLLSLLFPDLIAVESLIWNVVAGALYGIISSLLENLCGLNAPIIPDEPEEQELRDRVEAQSIGVVRSALESSSTRQTLAQPTEDNQSSIHPDGAESWAMKELGIADMHDNGAPSREAEE